MFDLKEWLRVIGYAMIAITIVAIVSIIAVLLIYPTYFKMAVNAGIDIGEKL